MSQIMRNDHLLLTSWSARGAVIECSRLGDSNNRNVFITDPELVIPTLQCHQM